MNNWAKYFERNAVERTRPEWNEPLNVPARILPALIRSIQRFQVGESGEGRHLRAAAAARGDTDYIRAIELFVKEEQEHARMMASFLKLARAPLLSGHWSDHCFVFLRRLFRLEHELLVLLIPEMIALRYFRMVHDGIFDTSLRAMCAQILRDERGHVAFHIEYLERAFNRMALPTRMVVRFAWRVVFRLACLVVLFDHRSLLKALAVTPAQFWWDCELIFDQAAATIFRTAPSSVAAPDTLARSAALQP